MNCNLLLVLQGSACLLKLFILGLSIPCTLTILWAQAL